VGRGGGKTDGYYSVKSDWTDNKGGGLGEKKANISLEGVEEKNTLPKTLDMHLPPKVR